MTANRRRVLVLGALPALAIAALLCLDATQGAGAGNTSAAPRGHPRILLDRATLRDLRARARHGSGNWKTLRAVCDSYRPGKVELPDGEEYPDDGGIGPGYQGDGYLPAVYAIGLCYQTALGADRARAGRYGKVGAELVSKMATEGRHAAKPPTDSVYGIRNYGTGLAIGYDWLHAKLDAATRARVRRVIGRWIRAYEREGFGREFPQGNYFAGYYAATALSALATAGEGPPISWRRWLRDIHNRRVRPYYERNLRGGGWPEGWNYGPFATMNQSLPVLAARSARGIDLTRGPGGPYHFPLGAGRFLVHFTWPDRATLEDSDAVYDSDNPTRAQSWLFTFQAAVLASAHDRFAPYLRSFARAVRKGGGEASFGEAWDAWIAFLFDRGGRSRDFRRLPRSYLARGIEMAAMRSSWSRSAVWAAFNAGPYVNNPDNGEEYFDKGSLAIVNGRRPFLVNAFAALLRNTPGTNDGSQFYTPAYEDNFGDAGTHSLYNVLFTSRPVPMGQGSRLRLQGARTRISAFEDRAGTVFARGSDLEDQYPRQGKSTIKRWTREVAYLRPGTFVVHDRTSVTDPSLDQWLAFHLGGRPDPSYSDGGVEGYDARSRGSFLGRVHTVLPSGHRDDVVDVFNGGKVFRLEVHAPAGRQHGWLTVFEAAAGAGATGRASPLTSGAGTVLEGPVEGVLLRGQGRDEAVLFSNRAATRPVVEQVRYRIPASATRHLVTGLRPRTRYRLDVGRAGADVVVSLRRGAGSGSIRASRAGVLRFNTS